MVATSASLSSCATMEKSAILSPKSTTRARRNSTDANFAPWRRTCPSRSSLQPRTRKSLLKTLGKGRKRSSARLTRSIRCQRRHPKQQRQPSKDSSPSGAKLSNSSKRIPSRLQEGQTQNLPPQKNRRCLTPRHSDDYSAQRITINNAS